MFQPLSDLQVDPHRNIANAIVALNHTAGTFEGGESEYPLHPIALDAAFQLAIISFYGGQLEIANAAYVPVHLSQVYLKADVNHDWAKVIAYSSAYGSRNAYARLQMMDPSGDMFLEVESMRFTTFKESKVGKLMHTMPFNSPFTRLVWKPDIHMLNERQIRELFPPPCANTERAAALENIDLICCFVTLDIYEKFIATGNGPRLKGEMRHWLDWIKRTVEEDQRPNMMEVRKLSFEQRHERLQKLYDDTIHEPEAKAAKLI